MFFVGIHRDQEEQFKVELFESIAKLNKLKEFSKSSYTETASVVGIVRREYKKGWATGKKNGVFSKVWNKQGRLYTKV